MALDMLAGQDDIMDALRAIEGVDVYEGQYLTDGAVPSLDENGLFPPYITTIFGAVYQGSSRGIVSERLNTLRTTVTVYVVSPTDRLTREYIDKVRDALLGLVPTDGTELQAFGGYDFVDADLGVNRYVHSSVYQYDTNMGY